MSEETKTPVKTMSYKSLKLALGANKLVLFNGKNGKRGFVMLNGEAVATLKEGLTVQEFISAPEEMQMVVQGEKGYFLTISSGVEY